MAGAGADAGVALSVSIVGIRPSGSGGTTETTKQHRVSLVLRHPACVRGPSVEKACRTLTHLSPRICESMSNLSILQGLLTRAKGLGGNAAAPARDHVVPPSLAQIQQQVAAIGANAAPVDGFALILCIDSAYFLLSLSAQNLLVDAYVLVSCLVDFHFRASPQRCRGRHAG
jgi:hypothetical protein